MVTTLAPLASRQVQTLFVATDAAHHAAEST